MNTLSGIIKLGLQTAIAAIFLQIGTIGQGYAQSFSFSGKRNKETFSFSLVKNLVILPIYLNDKGPYNFILDTGVGQLVITDPSLVDTLDIKSKRTIKVSGYGGREEMEAYVSTDISISLRGLRLTNVPTAILKSDVFNLSNYLGTKVHGLLGYPFFKDFIVGINYSTKRVSVRLRNRSVKKLGEPVPIDIIDNKPFVTAKVDTGNDLLEVLLILDNGASHAVSLEKHEGRKFTLPDKNIPANLGVGLGGKISGRIGRAPSLSLGSFSLKNVLASFPDYEHVGSKSLHKDRNGNLGADFLKRFNLTFDYMGSVMYLKKNQYFKDPFEHDMSGMEVYVEENNSNNYFIGRIEPGSPAEKAGFQVGDQLASVNFKQANNFTLDELSALLKSKNGRQFLVEIYRDGHKTMKLLKLEQRI
jgi:hypothetical protein